MIWVVVFAVGLVIGLAVGRWWALLAAVAFGAYIWVETPVDEVSPGFLGLMYALFAAAGVASGVVIRRRAAR